MKATYLLFSLGLVSAANIIGRHPEESESVSVEGSSDNIFDEIINNNNANREDDKTDDNEDLNNFLQGFRQGGLNLNDLNIDGLNFGNIDLSNQDALAEGILSLLAGFCVNNIAFDHNNILNLGLNNELELFFELAQLAQLQQLGFLSGNGLRGLFNSGVLLGGGGFNIGHFKREVAEMKKTMKRTKLRRGAISKNQCAQLNLSSTTTAAFESVVATSTVESSSIASAVEAAEPTAEATASEAVASSSVVEASSTAVATSSEVPGPSVPQETSDIVLGNPEG